MAVATQTVVVQVVLTGAQAQQMLQQIGGAAQQAGTQLQKTGQATNTASRNFRQLGSIVATLEKALISMLGVLIVFNLVVTLPEKIIQGVVVAFRAGVQAVADFEQQMVSLSAIIASTQNYSAKATENYVKSTRIANAVLGEFYRRGNETIATTEELGIIFQNIVAVGGNYVKTYREAIDLTILLSNAIAAVTSGQDRSRQFAQETRALFQQQTGVAATLNRLLFGSRSEMERFWQAADTGTKFVDELQKKLEGFAQAAMDLGQTVEGIKSSFIDFGTIFARMALSSALGSTKTFFSDLRAFLTNDIELVMKLGATISSSLLSLMKTLAREFGVTDFSAKSFLEGAIRLFPKIVGYIAEVVVHLKNAYLIIRAIVPIAWPIFTFIIYNLRAIIDIVIGIARIIWGTFNDIAEWLSSLGQKITLSQIGTNLKERLKDIVGSIDSWKAMGKIAGEAFVLAWDTVLGRVDIEDFVPRISAAFSSFVAEGEKSGQLTRGVVDFLSGIVGSIKFAIDGLRGLAKLEDAAAVGGATVAHALAGVNTELDKIRQREGDRRLLEEMLGGRLMPIDIDALLRPINARLAQTNTITRDVARQFNILRLSLEGVVSPRFTQSIIVGFIENLDRLRARMQPTVEDIEKLRSNLASIWERNPEEDYETVIAKIEQLESALTNLGNAALQAQQQFAGIFNTSITDIGNMLRNKIGGDFIEAIYRAKTLDKVKASVVSLKIQFQELSGAVALSNTMLGPLTDLLAPATFEATQGMTSDLVDNLLDAASAVLIAKDAVDLSSTSVAKSLKSVGSALAENAIQVFAAIGNELGKVLEGFFEALFFGGEKLKPFRQFIGDIIIMIGQLLVTLGTMALLICAFMPKLAGLLGIHPGGGALMLAAGAAAIALGVAIRGGSGAKATSTGGGGGGGGGAEVTPYYVRNQDVAAQQSIQYALNQNTAAINGLNAEVSRLSKESGDVLVQKAVTKNPAAVAKPIVGAVARSFTLQKELGGAMVGANV